MPNSHQTIKIVDQLPIYPRHMFIPSHEGILSVFKQVSRKADPNRIPTVKSTITPAQMKENVIEAEIRAQQERERELQLDQIKKNQQNLNDNLRNKGASSPHDSDEGFVDPPIEKTNTNSSSKQSTPVTQNIINTSSSGTPTSEGFTHSVTDANGDTAIYDAVSPVSTQITR